MPRLLGSLVGGSMSPTQHLEQQQALVKQFAEILEFVLKFDEYKVSITLNNILYWPDNSLCGQAFEIWYAGKGNIIIVYRRYVNSDFTNRNILCVKCVNIYVHDFLYVFVI